MSLCHLDSYVWVVCLWKRFFQNVHFLCMWLMSADELLGIRKSGKLGEIKNILRLQKLSGSLECESSEDFWATVLFHLGGVLPNRVRYVLHTVRLARQVLGLCLQTFPLQMSTKYFFSYRIASCCPNIKTCCNNSCAISVKSRSTLSQLLAEVCRKYIPCLLICCNYL